MSKFKRFMKTFIRISLTTLFCGGLACLGIYGLITANTNLKTENLNAEPYFATTVFADNGERLTKNQNTQQVKLKEVPTHTLQTFVYTEDKRFYSHHGLDYLRIAGATIQNIKRKKWAQGGSTISQQLIKNTHLTNEKTLSRKLKEVKLTKQLERTYTKEQILEMYLNRIYFGNSCYGLAQASMFYFNTPYQKLSLNQSAVLAGIINAPSIFDPIQHPSNTLEKRNKILKNLQNNQIISEKTYKNEKNKPLNIHTNALANDDMYMRYVLHEAKNILHVNENILANQAYKIHTYLNPELQKKLQNTLSQTQPNGNETMSESIIINNHTHSVVAYGARTRQKNIFKQRMPGSVLKPILVYAPAFEIGAASPATIIQDTPYNLNGYKPQNADKKFHGNVSVRNSIAHSYNIPAVKLLDKIGIQTAKDYAQKNHITFSKEDIYPSMALGAMQNGTSLVELTNAYATFANQGIYYKPNFIQSITNPQGKIIYSAPNNGTKVFSPETCYLMHSCLHATVTQGTAKTLKQLQVPIYAKTGTAGCAGTTNNTDAWCIAYTQKYTVGTWFGATESSGMPASINGATYPCKHIEALFSSSKQLQNSQAFPAPSGVVSLPLHTESLKKGELAIAAKSVPERYIVFDIFAKKFTPKKTDDTYAQTPSSSNLQAKQNNDQITFTFCANQGYTYIIKNNSGETIYSTQGNNQTETYIYTLPQKNEVVTFTLYQQKSDEENSSPHAVSQIKLLH